MSKFIRKIWHDFYYAVSDRPGLEFALRCKDVTAKIDLPASDLSLSQKFRLRLHISLCQACANYEHASQALRQAANELVRKELAYQKIETLNKRLLDKYKKN